MWLRVQYTLGYCKKIFRYNIHQYQPFRIVNQAAIIIFHFAHGVYLDMTGSLMYTYMAIGSFPYRSRNISIVDFHITFCEDK